MTLAAVGTERPSPRLQVAWRLLRVCGVRLDTKGVGEVAWVVSWFCGQQPKILARFCPDRNDQHTLEPLHDESYWWQKLVGFHDRATRLTLESPEGRQAVFEMAATALGWCASILRVYGRPISASDDFRDGLDEFDAMTKP